MFVLARWLGPREARLALLVAVIGAGAVLRILTLAALPDFFGPGDPATYWSMAAGVLREGVPRVDFVWNYSGAPAAISHVESYYEPAYAYVLALPMALFGARPAVGRALSVAFGVLAILLTWTFARRHGPRVALLATTLVALEPWSIYYSGVLMKETLVSVVVILALQSLRRVVESGGSNARAGVIAALVVLAASAFQYELLPILALATAITLARLRRGALLSFVTTAALVSGAAALATWAWMSVPLSGKFGFFMGQKMWTPAWASSGGQRALHLWRFLPAGYVLGALILKWYLPVAALAWVGTRARGLTRAEVMLPASFALCFIYFHGVPHDLWERDFIALLPVAAPFAALAACRGDAWTPGRATAVLGLVAGGALGTYSALTNHVAGFFPVRWMPWSVIASTLLFAFPMAYLVRRWMPAVVAEQRLRRWLPAAALGLVLASFSQSLPWPLIFSNPQFRDYEARRAAREQACGLLRPLPAGAVMSSEPAETHLDSGRPAVLLPIPRDAGVIAEVRKRYRLRYLLAAPGELDEGTATRAGLQQLGRRAGFVLYEFVPGAPALPVAGGPGPPG